MWMIFFLWDIICFCTTFWWPDGVTHSLSRLKRDNLPGGSSALQQVRVPVHYVVTVVLLFYIIYEKKKLFASSVGVNLNDLRSEVGYLRFHMATMHLIWYIWLVLLFSYNFFFFVCGYPQKGKSICHNKTYQPITLVKNDASLTQFWYLEAIAYTTTMIVCSYMF